MTPFSKQNEDVMDVEKAMARLGDDEQMLGELARIFLEECPTWMQEIDEAIAENDAEKLTRAAHTIKGSADVFAARSTVQAALHLEKMGRYKTFEDIDNAWANLKIAMVWLRQALEELMESLQQTPGQEEAHP